MQCRVARDAECDQNFGTRKLAGVRWLPGAEKWLASSCQQSHKVPTTKSSYLHRSHSTNNRRSLQLGGSGYHGCRRSRVPPINTRKYRPLIGNTTSIQYCIDLCQSNSNCFARTITALGRGSRLGYRPEYTQSLQSLLNSWVHPSRSIRHQPDRSRTKLHISARRV